MNPLPSTKLSTATGGNWQTTVHRSRSKSNFPPVTLTMAETTEAQASIF